MLKLLKVPPEPKFPKKLDLATLDYLIACYKRLVIEKRNEARKAAIRHNDNYAYEDALRFKTEANAIEDDVIADMDSLRFHREYTPYPYSPPSIRLGPKKKIGKTGGGKAAKKKSSGR